MPLRTVGRTEAASVCSGVLRRQETHRCRFFWFYSDIVRFSGKYSWQVHGNVCPATSWIALNSWGIRWYNLVFVTLSRPFLHLLVIVTPSRSFLHLLVIVSSVLALVKVKDIHNLSPNGLNTRTRSVFIVTRVRPENSHKISLPVILA